MATIAIFGGTGYAGSAEDGDRPGAGGGDVGNDRVSAHGEPADGFSLNTLRFKQLEEGMACEAAALGVQGGGAAVDVIVAGAAGGELELAETKAELSEQGEQLLGVGWGGHRF